MAFHRDPCVRCGEMIMRSKARRFCPYCGHNQDRPFPAPSTTAESKGLKDSIWRFKTDALLRIHSHCCELDGHFDHLEEMIAPEERSYFKGVVEFHHALKTFISLNQPGVDRERGRRRNLIREDLGYYPGDDPPPSQR